MELYNLIWQPTAKEELGETLKYFAIRNGNNDYSHKLLISINKTINTLTIFPHIGKPTDFKYIRELIHLNYSIFYTIFEVEIHIVLFWDNRRSPELLESELGKILNPNS